MESLRKDVTCGCEKIRKNTRRAVTSFERILIKYRIKETRLYVCFQYFLNTARLVLTKPNVHMANPTSDKSLAIEQDILNETCSKTQLEPMKTQKLITHYKKRRTTSKHPTRRDCRKRAHQSGVSASASCLKKRKNPRSNDNISNSGTEENEKVLMGWPLELKRPVPFKNIFLSSPVGSRKHYLSQRGASRRTTTAECHEQRPRSVTKNDRVVTALVSLGSHFSFGAVQIPKLNDQPLVAFRRRIVGSTLKKYRRFSSVRSYKNID